MVGFNCLFETLTIPISGVDEVARLQQFSFRLLMLLAGALVPMVMLRAAPPADSVMTIGGARLGPVPEVLYTHLPSLPRGQGAVVEALTRNSTLAQAGLRRYDIVLTLDGTTIHSPKHFVETLSAARPDQVHRLGLLRAGRPMTLTLPAAEMPKSVLKPGGPPAVAIEAQPLQGGKLKVRLVYYSQSGKLQQVSCSGSLSEIEQQVRQLGRQNQMPARVQDLVDVALRRIRALNSSEGQP
jgi:hypothetical protein